MRQSDRPLVALEQLDAKIIFERGDPGGDCRLRGVELLRSGGKAAQARNPDEGFDEAQFKRPSYGAPSHKGSRKGAAVAFVFAATSSLAVLRVRRDTAPVEW